MIRVVFFERFKTSKTPLHSAFRFGNALISSSLVYLESLGPRRASEHARYTAKFVRVVSDDKDVLSEFGAPLNETGVNQAR